MAALATASGADYVSTAVAMAAVLGGIAGPSAGILGMAGDLIHPGLNLVATGQDNVAWCRLEELLLGPVEACQRRLQGISRAVEPDRLDGLEHSRFNERLQTIKDHGKASMFPEDGLPQPYLHEQFHLVALRTPTFFLRQPDRATWEKALPELMGTSALVWDGGCLLEELSVKSSTKGAASSFPAQLVALATGGQERYIERSKQDGPGRIDTVRAHLFVRAGRDQVRDALGAADQPALQRLLQGSALLDPTRDGPGVTLNRDGMRIGYEAYLGAVKTILNARRNGPGYQIKAQPDISEFVQFKLNENIHAWLGRLPPRLLPFFNGSTSLAYRLCWAFSATRAQGEGLQWLLHFLYHVTQRHLRRQKEFLEKQFLAAEVVEQERARLVMLRKLVNLAPCPLRELLRRYPNQRRALHEPVLTALIQAGQVLRAADGRLELTDAGRKAV